MGEDVVLATVEEAVLHMPHPTAPTTRAAFESLECDHFRLRASVMKECPKVPAWTIQERVESSFGSCD